MISFSTLPSVELLKNISAREVTLRSALQNLDVNLAVNNLLSRDDEEGDEGSAMNDDAPGEGFMSEDLMSLLDGPMQPDSHNHPSVIIDPDAMFSEDMFGPGNPSSFSRRSGRGNSKSTTGENNPFLRMGRDSRQLAGNAGSSSSRKGWLESTLKDSSSDSTDMSSSKKNKNPVWISEDIEFWPGHCKFVHIISLYSELCALSTTGQLHQWKWWSCDPYRGEMQGVFHPKTISLNLLHERISLLDGRCARASVVTESGKVATFVDESLNPVAFRLEQQATLFSELQGERIQSIHVCSLYSCVRLYNGSIYWWGVLPFSQRKKIWERMCQRSKQSKGSSSQNSEIVVDSQVCMRYSPVYHPGALAFTTANGHPRVGQLLAAAWNLPDACQFKIINPKPTTVERSSSQPPPDNTSTSNDRTEMPPPPSPASSTCSEPPPHSPLSHKRKKTQRADDDGKSEEEEWALKDVVFVEDVKNVPIGRVVKVDGIYVAVKFPNKEGTGGDKDDPLSDCRLMRKDEIQVVRGGSSASTRTLDCLQRTPKRVSFPDNVDILSMSVDARGMHAIIKNKKSNQLRYAIYNVSTGRAEQDSLFPILTSSFLAPDSSQVSLSVNGENETISLLRDGNSCLFPVAHDCVDAIRDPVWLNLPPVRAIGMGVQPLRDVSQNQKNQVAVIALVLEPQTIMPAILKANAEAVGQVLSSAKRDMDSEGDVSILRSILSERCDGNRNIIHAAVSVSFPTSNKNTDSDASQYEALEIMPSSAAASASGSQPISGRNISLSEMMRRARGGDPVVDLQGSSQESDSEYQPIPRILWPSEESVQDGDTHGDQGFQSGSGQSDLGKNQGGLASLTGLLQSPVLRPHLFELLYARDATGQTPFMTAVTGRAYRAATIILDAAQR